MRHNMLDTIELRLDNAADALLHVAVNVMETGFDNLEAIFQDKTLGKLHPSRTIVNTLFRKFMASKEFRHYHYEILQEYMEELDFASVSNEKQRKYIQLFGQHMGIILNNSQLNNSKMENELTKTSNDDSEALKNANEHPASQVTNFSVRMASESLQNTKTLKERMYEKEEQELDIGNYSVPMRIFHEFEQKVCLDFAECKKAISVLQASVAEQSLTIEQLRQENKRILAQLLGREVQNKPIHPANNSSTKSNDAYDTGEYADLFREERVIYENILQDFIGSELEDPAHGDDGACSHQNNYQPSGRGKGGKGLGKGGAKRHRKVLCDNIHSCGIQMVQVEEVGQCKKSDVRKSGGENQLGFKSCTENSTKANAGPKRDHLFHDTQNKKREEQVMETGDQMRCTKRKTDGKLLYVDGIRFFVYRLFWTAENANYWTIATPIAMKKAKKFVESANHAGWKLKIFIDASLTNPPLENDKWKRQQSRLRYAEANYIVYSDVNINWKGALEFSLGPREEFKKKCNRQLPLETPQVNMIKYPIMADAIEHKEYSRASPTTLLKYVENPHIIIRELRQALYSKLGIEGPIKEEMPTWNLTLEEVEWLAEDVEPDESFGALLDQPMKALTTFFPNTQDLEDLAAIVPFEKFRNHIFSVCVVCFEICAIATGQDLRLLIHTHQQEIKTFYGIQGTSKAQPSIPNFDPPSAPFASPASSEINGHDGLLFS